MECVVLGMSENKVQMEVSIPVIITDPDSSDILNYDDVEEEQFEEDVEEDEDEEEEQELGSKPQSEPVGVSELYQGTSSNGKSKPRKYAFKLEHSENGNILTVHHTLKEEDRFIRIRISVCCFNEQGTQLVVIDKRGSIFVFDFVAKRYWLLHILLPKACSIRASQQYNSDYLVGNKLGQLFIIDVENSQIISSAQLANDPIEEISFGPKTAKIPNALLRIGADAHLLKLKDFKPTYHLQFDQMRYTLKFASFLPYSDQIFTCFTNDSVHISSTTTLSTIRIFYPIKSRERKLRLLQSGETVPEFSLRKAACDNDSDGLDEFDIDCTNEDISNGYLLSYCFTPDGNKFCLTTCDGYLMMHSSQTFDLEKLFRMRDFILKQVIFLPQPKERILFGVTTKGQVLLMDLANVEYKLIVQTKDVRSITMSRGGKKLAVLSKHGEVNIWAICRLYNTLESQVECMTMLRSEFKQKKPHVPSCSVTECLSEDLRKLLKRDRLMAILKEFGSYPSKYRHLIWTSLLQLPCNGPQYQQLLKLGVPSAVREQARNLKVKNESIKRSMIKIWSCLGHWCKVFAYAEFVPHLIFPFVKMFPKNGLVCLEILISLILNHFQLWLEFYPLEPSNYLAMCENLLQHNDDQLCKYFAVLGLTPKEYAWPLLSNAFSEVLDEEQWLILWDHVVTEPPYFIVFITVAYNIVQREVLLRLPNKSAVNLFYHEQNPIDVQKLLSKAHKIKTKCPHPLHPERYVPSFVAIPKGVYPKFLNYPNKWLEQQEIQTVSLNQQHKLIDARLRELELSELKVMESLEEGLKREEHERRVKEMEKRYHDTIRHEEERIACQRKMMLLYQKEIRARKCEVLDKIKECEERRKAIVMEKDLAMLLSNVEQERHRNNQELLLAEDEIRNQEVELLEQKYNAKMQTTDVPLARKFYENVKRLCRERELLDCTLHQMKLEELMSKNSCISVIGPPSSTDLSDIEKSIMDIQRELIEIATSGNNGKNSG